MNEGYQSTDAARRLDNNLHSLLFVVLSAWWILGLRAKYCCTGIDIYTHLYVGDISNAH